jgi:hypothetical protein
LITATQFLSSASCHKDTTRPCNNFTPYNFLVTAQWQSEQDIYRTGDTIYLISSFSKDLLNTLDNVQINYNNAVGIGGSISIGLLDTITHQRLPANDSFNIISFVGSFEKFPINTINQGINFSYLELNSTYEFKIGFIPKYKGIYGIGVSDLRSLGLKGKNCTNANFDMTIINNNKHLYLHQYALGVDTNDSYLQKHGYDFRVQ